MTDLVLGVPSKGRLMEKTFEWFGTRGISPADNKTSDTPEMPST